MKTMLIRTLSVLAAVPSMAAAAPLEAIIHLTQKDSITIRAEFAGLAQGQVTAIESQEGRTGDEWHGLNIYCQTAAKYEGAIVSLTVLDTSKKQILQTSNTLSFTARHTTGSNGSGNCSDSLPRGALISATSAGEFIEIEVPLNGKMVKVALEFRVNGSVQLSDNKFSSASIRIEDLSSVNYFINNGRGVSKDQANYGRGSAPLIDPSKPVKADGGYCSFHPYDCRNN